MIAIPSDKGIPCFCRRVIAMGRHAKITFSKSWEYSLFYVHIRFWVKLSNFYLHASEKNKNLKI